MPVGQPLTEIIETCNVAALSFYFIKWIDGLKKLHQAKIVHGDVRPDNVLVVGDDLMFIDWQSRGTIGQPLRELRSSPPSMPSRWLDTGTGTGKALICSALDDIEQMVYAFTFFLNDQRYPWMSTKLDETVHTNLRYQEIVAMRQNYYLKGPAESYERILYNQLQKHSGMNAIPDSEYQHYIDVFQLYIDIFNGLL
jgi:hypothetical protein